MSVFTLLVHAIISGSMFKLYPTLICNAQMCYFLLLTINPKFTTACISGSNYKNNFCTQWSDYRSGSALYIKSADFLREILLAITLEPFTQTECSFHQTKHTSFLKQKMSTCAGGVKLSCTNFGRHFFQSIFGTIL